MQIYQAIVKGLENVGVDTAFGGNGENIASLTVALKHSRIRAIATPHEILVGLRDKGQGAASSNKRGCRLPESRPLRHGPGLLSPREPLAARPVLGQAPAPRAVGLAAANRFASDS
jgi:hypothetical protein